MKKGFTLIEILIAISIFAVMAVITSITLYSVFSARDNTTNTSVKISQIQLAMIVIERDLSQIIIHQVLNPQGARYAVIGSTNNIEFSKGGMINPQFKRKLSTFGRVHYWLEGKNLMRSSHPLVDNKSTSLPVHTEKLLENVESISFQYLDKYDHNRTQWLNKKLPKGIRLDIKLIQLGTISLIYPLPQGQYYELKLGER